MDSYLSVNTLIAGKINLETIINLNKEYFIDRIGGNLLYTAYGYNLWRKGAGLAARVGENFSEEWLDPIGESQFNINGIIRMPLDLDLRSFYAFIQEEDVRIENPQKYFSELNLPFPRSLLGYAPTQFELDNRKSGSDISIRTEDIPQEFMNCQFLYLCPIDFYTHSLLPPHFRSNPVGEVFINPAPGYMHSSFWFDVPNILRGSTAVITTTKRAKNLFTGRSNDLWEMAEGIASFGVELVVITAGKDGQYLYEKNSRKKCHFPAYPSKVVDTIGANDAFGGGFLAGYTTYFDPIQSVLMGNVAASIKVEGSTPNYLLHAMPELLKVRFETLQNQVVEC